jgi:GGDEF domain-containing protein
MAHYGRIWAESDPGQGSRFSFVIPSLSPHELLLRALASELERAQTKDSVTSLLLVRLVNASEVRERMGEDGPANFMREFLAASRRVVRRSSDRVLWDEEALEVAIILPRTATDGGRAFGARLLEGVLETQLREAGALLTVSAVEYPKDGRSAEELYQRACESVHEPARA